jgi:hypothetical protein
LLQGRLSLRAALQPMMDDLDGVIASLPGSSFKPAKSEAYTPVKKGIWETCRRANCADPTETHKKRDTNSTSLGPTRRTVSCLRGRANPSARGSDTRPTHRLQLAGFLRAGGCIGRPRLFPWGDLPIASPGRGRRVDLLQLHDFFTGASTPRSCHRVPCT